MKSAYAAECRRTHAILFVVAVICALLCAASLAMVPPALAFAYAAGSFRADALWGDWLDRKEQR